MSKNNSPLVRSWAVRGLTKPQADSANVGAAAEARLLVSSRDPDRAVSTEAVRALGTYSDSAALTALVAALQSPDSWISVSAAEGLGRARSTATIPALLVAAADQGSCALRVTSMNSLQNISRGWRAVSESGSPPTACRIAGRRRLSSWLAQKPIRRRNSRPLKRRGSTPSSRITGPPGAASCRRPIFRRASRRFARWERRVTRPILPR